MEIRDFFRKLRHCGSGPWGEEYGKHLRSKEMPAPRQAGMGVHEAPERMLRGLAVFILRPFL
jgi:hypothetical protein